MIKFLLLFISLFFYSSLSATVEYRLTYNVSTATYTVSVRSNTAYSNAFARLTASTQFTIVAPDPDGAGAGAYAIVNLSSASGTSNLTWSSSQINSPVQNPSKDYLVFAPSNAGSYVPFDIPANTWIDLFTFQTTSGCLGALYVYENNANNTDEPMNGQSTYNLKNNFKVLGGGNVNQWASNASGNVPCTSTCAAEAGVLGY